MNRISIKFGQEEMISRVPSLFPYIEFDENGISHVRPAHESTTGSYGHIAAGVSLPGGICGQVEVDGEIWEIVTSDSNYSYKALMDYYYQYKDYATSDDTFMAFMERGIGKVTIDADIDFEECDLVPEYVYMSECGGWYNEMAKMKISIDNYLIIKQSTGEVNCEMECLIDKYNRMGGDTMKGFYYDKWQESITIADEYYEYAVKDLPVIRCDFFIGLTMNDVGYKTTYINYFVPGDVYEGGDIVTYNGRSYICNLPAGQQTRGKWNIDYEEYEFDPDSFTLLTESYTLSDNLIEGTTSSKLSGFKRKRNYLNSAGTVEVPTSDTDWLYYYRVGSLGHYETATDELGNIAIMEDETRVTTIGATENHLLAYGDIITGITYDADNYTITFDYVIGGNLQAKLIAIEVDDDNNYRYKYDDYEFNGNDSHGVKCKETFTYEPYSELDDLIRNGDFNTYVNNDNVAAQYVFDKMEFNMSNATTEITTVYNGTPTTYRVTKTNFISTITNPKDTLVAPVFKKDYLEGISYPPQVDADVFVNRGNAASWERHMKLGEVKTFNDLENYANGGFFNII